MNAGASICLIQETNSSFVPLLLERRFQRTKQILKCSAVDALLTYKGQE